MHKAFAAAQSISPTGTFKHTMPPPNKLRHLHRRRNAPNGGGYRAVGGSMFIIAWLLLLGMLYIYFKDQQESQLNPNQKPTSSIENNRKTLTLKANRQNHFVMTGQINGQDVTLLLDTGATRVSVPEKIANQLNLRRGYASVAQTANGSVRVYDTNIDTLSLGDIKLHDVPAHINPGMNNMREILLGMSALSQVEFTQREGTLIITQ